MFCSRAKWFYVSVSIAGGDHNAKRKIQQGGSEVTSTFSFQLIGHFHNSQQDLSAGPDPPYLDHPLRDPTAATTGSTYIQNNYKLFASL